MKLENVVLNNEVRIQEINMNERVCKQKLKWFQILRALFINFTLARDRFTLHFAGLPLSWILSVLNGLLLMHETLLITFL